MTLIVPAMHIVAEEEFMNEKITALIISENCKIGSNAFKNCIDIDEISFLGVNITFDKTSFHGVFPSVVYYADELLLSEIKDVFGENKKGEYGCPLYIKQNERDVKKC